MKLVLQGYDYAIPSLKNRFSFRYPLQLIVNKRVDTGQWLARPMMIKGITDAKVQRSIIRFMIFEFNEMLKRVVEKFDRVVLIDCRDVAAGQRDWYDELHLKSHKFKDIAKVYMMVIDDHPDVCGKRVVRVVNYLEKQKAVGVESDTLLPK